MNTPTATDAVKSNLSEAGSHLKSAASAAGEALKGAAGSAGDELKLGKANVTAELADSALSGLAAAESGGAAAKEQVDALMDKGRDLIDSAADLIRERPLASFGVAFAAGWIIAKLARSGGGDKSATRVSEPRDASDERPGDGTKPPDLGEAIREVGAAARAGLSEAGNAAKAFRTLVAADVSLARSAFGRAMALTGVAIVFGASCWLLLMATLIVFLHRQLGLPLGAALLICALLSGAVTVWAAWQADRYFDHTRMQATRRQLARLGIGELADFTPDAGSPESARARTENAPPSDADGKPPQGDAGIPVTPP